MTALLAAGGHARASSCAGYASVVRGSRRGRRKRGLGESAGGAGRLASAWQKREGGGGLEEPGRRCGARRVLGCHRAASGRGEEEDKARWWDGPGKPRL